MFVDEIVQRGMQRFINISNIDVTLQVVGGDGVIQADIDKNHTSDVAKGWCKRCVEYLLPAIASSCSISDRNDLIKTMLSRLSDASKNFPNDPELQEIIAKLRHEYAALAEKMGNWDQAINAQAAALQGFEHLAEGDNRDTQHISNLSVALLSQGDIEVQQSTLDIAQHSYERARELSMGLQTGENAEFAIACDKLGDLARSQGELAVAHDYYAQALPVFRKLAGMASNSRRDLCLCLSKLGELAIAEKEFEQAHLFLEEHLNIATRIAQSNPENAEYQRDLSGAYGRMMGLAQAQNDIPAAVHYAENALRILETFVMRDITNAAWQQDLAGSFYNLGNVVEGSGNPKRAAALFTKSLEYPRWQLGSKVKLYLCRSQFDSIYC
jgi:tetratricopeptide (TPR) repeat protein